MSNILKFSIKKIISYYLLLSTYLYLPDSKKKRFISLETKTVYITTTIMNEKYIGLEWNKQQITYF